MLAEGVNSSKGAEAQTSKNTGGAQVCEQTAQDGKRAVAGFSALRRKEVRTRIKYAVIYRHRKKYPVSVLCRFFQVSQNEYYDFVHCPGRLEEEAALTETIAEQ